MFVHLCPSRASPILTDTARLPLQTLLPGHAPSAQVHFNRIWMCCERARITTTKRIAWLHFSIDPGFYCVCIISGGTGHVVLVWTDSCKGEGPLELDAQLRTPEQAKLQPSPKQCKVEVAQQCFWTALAATIDSSFSHQATWCGHQLFSALAPGTQAAGWPETAGAKDILEERTRHTR